MPFVTPEELKSFEKSFAVLAFESYCVTCLRSGMTKEELLCIVDDAVKYFNEGGK